MKYRTLAVALVVVVVSGCGLTGGAGEETKGKAPEGMDMQEAGERAEQMLDGTFAVIRPSVETQRGPSSDSICTDFKNDATGTGSVTRRRYVLTIISDERRGAFLGVVERQWKKDGYEITSVRQHEQKPAIFASTPENFRVSLEFIAQGQAKFTVASPCVTESEVTEPPREPIDPDSPASRGLPYIHSEFWSAKTPPPSPATG